MKYLLSSIALSFLLLIGIVYIIGMDISGLKARDNGQKEEIRLLNVEIRTLRNYISMVDDKADRIEQAREEVFKPFTHIIPIDGGFLGIREERDDKD